MLGFLSGVFLQLRPELPLKDDAVVCSLTLVTLVPFPDDEMTGPLPLPIVELLLNLKMLFLTIALRGLALTGKSELFPGANEKVIVPPFP